MMDHNISCLLSVNNPRDKAIEYCIEKSMVRIQMRPTPLIPNVPLETVLLSESPRNIMNKTLKKSDAHDQVHPPK